MYDDRIKYHPGYFTSSLGTYNEAAGTGRHRAPTDVYQEPLVPPDATWDPAEELAFMLQEGLLQESQDDSFRRIPPARDEVPDTPPASGPHLRKLQDLTAEIPSLKAAPRGHRKERERASLVRTVSWVIAAMVTLIVSAVSFIGGVAAYDPLHLIAMSHAQHSITSWWPLLVYGPWLAASLSVLRAALHRRRAVHSWCVVVIFSAIAVVLSVAQAPRTVVDASATALPSLASLACFQQLVRQITLTRPPHKPVPRHRLQPSATRVGPGERSPRR